MCAEVGFSGRAPLGVTVPHRPSHWHLAPASPGKINQPCSQGLSQPCSCDHFFSDSISRKDERVCAVVHYSPAQRVNLTLSCTMQCNKRCLLSTTACLLSPAAVDCYICCCRLLCEPQARGRSGLETILGRFLSNQFLGRFGLSLEHKAARLHVVKFPLG